MPRKKAKKSDAADRTRARVEKLIEDEVRKARNYFRAVVQHSPVGMVVTTMDRSIVMVNQTAENLLGFSENELVGEDVRAFYPANEKAEHLDIAAMRGGERLSKEFEFVKKDGSTVPVIATYALINGVEGFGDVIIESYNDQSVRRRLDKLKNEFVFVAAHELRNPVTAIRLLLDIVFDDKRLKIDPILRSYLQKMQEANDRLIQLVDDLLEVSRSESGRLKIALEPQNIVEHTESIIEELKPSAVAKEVEFRYDPAPDVPRVLADGSKLEEVMANLVSNAIKYNVSGGSVTVAHVRKGDMLLTTVSDSGLGIAEKDMEQLFQKFWRSEDMAVRAQSGTGLGLFIVKELIERMGGEVTVSSEHGKGSTFGFTLKIA